MRKALLFALFSVVTACSSADDPSSRGYSSVDSPPAADSDAGSASGPVLAGGDAGASSDTCAPGSSRACYPFASGKPGVGACKAGAQACSKSGEFGEWGACTGAVGPSPEVCGNGVDDDCNGLVDEGCDAGPAPNAPTTGQIEFHHLPDTASWTNCLKIQVNGGPEVDLGCNHGPSDTTATVTVNAPPFCNIVRLNLYSNGQFNKTTANPSQVADSFIIQQLGPGNFKVQCNDNYDNDYNDLNLTMNAVGNVDFTIENSGYTCN